MRRLLVVNVFFAPRSYGGATVVAEALARRVAASGRWAVSVLSFSDYGSDPAPALLRTRLPEGIDHWTINSGGPRPRDRSFENPAMEAEIARVVAEVRPDAAHVHCVNELGTGAVDALHAAGVPILLSTHDYWWLCERSFLMTGHGRHCGQVTIDPAVCAPCVETASTLPWRRRRAAETLAKAALVTYPSREARLRHEANGVPPERGVTLPNGVPPPGPDYPALRAARPSRRLRFGHVGGPGAIKGWNVIERAFAGLDPERAELVLVDAATNLGGSWWRGYRFGPLERHVRVVPGYRADEADGFFAGLDALLFLSAWPETFGLTTREAALRGVHVVATRCGAPVEPLTEGETATLLPFGAGARELRAALRRLVAGGLPSPGPAARARLAAEIVAPEAQAEAVLALLDRIAPG